MEQSLKLTTELGCHTKEAKRLSALCHSVMLIRRSALSRDWDTLSRRLDALNLGNPNIHGEDDDGGMSVPKLNDEIALLSAEVADREAALKLCRGMQTGNLRGNSGSVHTDALDWAPLDSALSFSDGLAALSPTTSFIRKTASSIFRMRRLFSRISSEDVKSDGMSENNRPVSERWENLAAEVQNAEAAKSDGAAFASTSIILEPIASRCLAAACAELQIFDREVHNNEVFEQLKSALSSGMLTGVPGNVDISAVSTSNAKSAIEKCKIEKQLALPLQDLLDVAQNVVRMRTAIENLKWEDVRSVAITLLSNNYLGTGEWAKKRSST